MAISDMLNRRVRARPDDNEEVYSEESDQGQDVSQDEDEEEQAESDADLSEDAENSHGSNQDEGAENSDEESGDQASGDDDNDDIKASLSNISFGALAKAQASMSSKKRKDKQSKSSEEAASPLDDIRARILEAREQKREAASKSQDSKEAKDKKDKKAAARASKHAPMVQSSTRAVTRKRTVIEPAAVARARDPRFDAAVMGHSGAGKNPDGANKAYAFLDEYRASELKDLKAQLAKTKNESQKEALKRQIRSATDQMRARASRKREQEVIADHKKREKQAIREGKKSTPYYLKNSDLKKQVIEKKYGEMGSRERSKALERRRKKMASKERKDMPMERRGMDDDAPPSRDGKRRRLA